MPFPSGLRTQLHQVWIQAREAEYSASLVFTIAAAVWHKQVTCLPVGPSDGKLPWWCPRCLAERLWVWFFCGRVRVRGNVCRCPCPWECPRICAQCPRVCLSADVAILMLRCSEPLLGVVVVENIHMPCESCGYPPLSGWAAWGVAWLCPHVRPRPRVSTNAYQKKPMQPDHSWSCVVCCPGRSSQGVRFRR